MSTLMMLLETVEAGIEVHEQITKLLNQGALNIRR